MLLQCEDDKIIILPALPNEMKKGCIRGLLAKGNITVDIEWENNKAKKIRLITPVSQGVVISVNGEDMEISLKENEEYIISVN